MHGWEREYRIVHCLRLEDVAKVASFLASDDASFINGADILIDGGLVALAP